MGPMPQHSRPWLARERWLSQEEAKRLLAKLDEDPAHLDVRYVEFIGAKKHLVTGFDQAADAEGKSESITIPL